MKATFYAFAAFAAVVAAGEWNSTSSSNMTISTVYATNIKTITSCAPTVTNCPASKTPVVVTETVALYTTYCPVGSNPTKPVETSPPVVTSKKEDVTTVTVYGCPTTSPATKPTSKPTPTPVVICPGADKCPGPATSAKSSAPSASAPSSTKPGQPKFTGAASANTVGGLIMVAGLAAALL